MLTNLTGIEEIIRLNNELLFNRLVELDEKIAGHISLIEVRDEVVYENISYRAEQREQGRYIVSVADEIIRLLSTPLGSRVMRPEYGSELYKLRDREFNDLWRLMATRYTFVAINRYIERVRCRKVLFEVLGDGRVKMNLELEKRDEY